MADFDKAVKIILEHEGGLVSDPDDPGGITKYGITARDFPHLDIKNLTIEQAKAIYRDKYWNKVRGDRINNQDIANQVFDFAVNAGYSRATKTIQELLKIKVDGIFGEQTISNINSVYYELFLANYKLERIKFYIELAKQPKRRKYLYSWAKRTLDT